MGGGRGGCDVGVESYTYKNSYIWKKKRKEKKRKGKEEHSPSLNCQHLAWKSHAVTTMPLLFFQAFFFVWKI